MKKFALKEEGMTASSFAGQTPEHIAKIVDMGGALPKKSPLHESQSKLYAVVFNLYDRDSSPVKCHIFRAANDGAAIVNAAKQLIELRGDDDYQDYVDESAGASDDITTPKGAREYLNGIDPTGEDSVVCIVDSNDNEIYTA